jgi:rare lipoprotein A
MRLTAGICAAKALVQLLCERFHDPDNVHVFIPGVSIHYRHKFCVQEVLMHMCLPPFYLNTFFRLSGNAFVVLVCSLIIILVSCAPYEKHPESGYGVASWYGPEFHGRPTSSGEIFNMNALTCAHKEFPFGTKLKVTNLSNNKSVECLVNDRGPFVSGRDLDLSYAAANEIGLLGKGTSRVGIEFIGRDISYIKEVRYSSNRGPFTIQVGSFRENTNALRLKTALELKYRNVYVTEKEIGGNIYFRVRTGKFQTKGEAYQLAKTLADEGYSIFIAGYDEKNN